MSEMVERVARAIAGRRAVRLIDTYGIDEGHLKNFIVLPVDIEDARAAIAAMREPTAKMVDAGCDEEKVGYAPDGAPADDVWRVMIDAALAEDNPS
jgi:hypothetical protein